MDFVGYAALGGLERVAIVAGAIVIGYWGYRLYTGERNVGLVFMGLSVAVLIGALVTAGSHMRSVTESYQVATAAPSEPAPVSEPAAAAERSPFAETAPMPAEAPAPVATPATAEPAAPPAEVVAEVTEMEEPAMAEETAAEEEMPEAVIAPVRIATGQELGGRIVSIKSENVSLEWSEESN